MRSTAASIHSRARRRALAVVLCGMACGNATGREGPEVPVTDEIRQQVAGVLAWPRPDLRVRRIRALQEHRNPPAPLHVEVDSALLGQDAAYRSWWRVTCSNRTGAWRCEPGEQVVELARGGEVVIGPQVSPGHIASLAHFMGHAPHRPGDLVLMAVRRHGGDYLVNYRVGPCEHLVRLRRGDDQFRAIPHNPVIKACRGSASS